MFEPDLNPRGYHEKFERRRLIPSALSVVAVVVVAVVVVVVVVVASQRALLIAFSSSFFFIGPFFLPVFFLSYRVSTALSLTLWPIFFYWRPVVWSRN